MVELLARMDSLNRRGFTSGRGGSEVRSVGSRVGRHSAAGTVARKVYVFVDVLVEIGRLTRLILPLMGRC